MSSRHRTGSNVKDGHGKSTHSNKVHTKHRDRAQEKGQEKTQEIDEDEVQRRKEEKRKKKEEEEKEDRRRKEEERKRKEEKRRNKEEGEKKKKKKEDGGKKRKDANRKVKEKEKLRQAHEAEKKRQKEARKRYEEESRGMDKGMPSKEQIEWAYECLCIPKDKRCERAVRLAYRKLCLAYHPSAPGNVMNEAVPNYENPTTTINAAFEFLDKMYKGKKDESAKEVVLDEDAFKEEVLENFKGKMKEWYKEDEEGEGDDSESEDSESDEGGYYPESRDGEKTKAGPSSYSYSPTSSTTASRPLAMDHNYGNEQARRLYEEQLKRSNDFVQQFAYWGLRSDETNDDDTAAARRSGRS